MDSKTYQRMARAADNSLGREIVAYVPIPYVEGDGTYPSYWVIAHLEIGIQDLYSLHLAIDGGEGTGYDERNEGFYFESGIYDLSERVAYTNLIAKAEKARDRASTR